MFPSDHLRPLANGQSIAVTTDPTLFSSLWTGGIPVGTTTLWINNTSSTNLAHWAYTDTDPVTVSAMGAFNTIQILPLMWNRESFNSLWLAGGASLNLYILPCCNVR